MSDIDLQKLHRPHQMIDGVLHLRCTRCGEFKPAIAGFHKLANPLSVCGRSSWCKACDHETRKTRKRSPKRRVAETAGVA